jgi:hypothetical protein
MNDNVTAAIDSERKYQDAKYPGHSHTTGEWLLIMEKCLADAKTAWNCGHGSGVLDEIRQVTAVGVAAMDQHGAPLRDPEEKKKKMRAALMGAVES